MKVVYLAGAYRATTGYGVHLNIQRAEALALEVWRLGAACICPHKNTAYFDGAAPDDVWLKGDLEILGRCDAMLVVPNSGNSAGTAVEIVEAQERGLSVFYSIADLREWLSAQR